MTVTEASLRARFPNAFPSSFPAAVLNAAIAEANRRVDPDVFGADLIDDAVTYLAAELALLEAIRTASTSSSGVRSRATLYGSISFGDDVVDLKSQADEFHSEFQRIQRLVTPVFALSGTE